MVKLPVNSPMRKIFAPSRADVSKPQTLYVLETYFLDESLSISWMMVRQLPLHSQKLLGSS
jgi:hypothetical protein